MRKALVISLVSITSLALAPRPAAATDIGVPGDQPTIQDAIDAAATGDTISVAPGTYAQTLDLSGKDIHLRSTGGPSVTTLEPDPPGGWSVTTLQITTGEGPGAIIEGFTFTNAGPVIVVDGASPTIRGNVFTQNWLVAVNVVDGSPSITENVFSLGQSDAMAISLGNSNSEVAFNSISDHPRGGVFVSGTSSPRIHHNTIKDSGGYDQWAPAIWVYTDTQSLTTIDHNLLLRNHGPALEIGAASGSAVNASVTENEFIENDYGPSASVMSAGGNPGAITFERNYCRGPAGTPGFVGRMIRGDEMDVVLRNAVFARLHDTDDWIWSSAVATNHGPMTLENCTFHDVETTIEDFYAPNSYAIDSIVWDWINRVRLGWTPIDYSDIGPILGDPGGTNNFTADPMFVNAAAGDYHLLAGSPCIDAPSGGTSAVVDLDGTPRDSLPDIGAYEYIGHDHWFRGNREKGGAMTMVFQGTPGEAVTLGYSPSVRQTPRPTPYGDLWVGNPLTRIDMGTIGPNGILEVSFGVPPFDLPTRFYTQALIGSTITPLQEVTLGG